MNTKKSEAVIDVVDEDSIAELIGIAEKIDCDCDCDCIDEC